MLLCCLQNFIMLKIVIPKNMSDTTLEHLERAGRKTEFGPGLDIGTSGQEGDQVIRLRSMDIPIEVDDTCDVGLCGSDWLEERKLELGIDLEVLSEYVYGRKFPPRLPTLDLVAREEDDVSNIEDLRLGSIVITEYPYLTENFLRERGFNRLAQLGKQEGAPTKPSEFRKWCSDEGYIGVRTEHGSISALVNVGSGYGVMVNETGLTLATNVLKVVDTVREIKTFLVVDKNALLEKKKGREIESFQRDLDRAYLSIYNESEAAMQMFKERL